MASVARETKAVESAAPFDPWDSPYWDLWHYEISDPTEVAELDRLAVDAEIDRHDAPHVPLNQISPDEFSMMAAGLPLG
jgi:hypothetical protein